MTRNGNHKPKEDIKPDFSCFTACISTPASSNFCTVEAPDGCITW